MVPKQKHYVSQLLKVVEIEHVKSEDVKKKLKGCKFSKGNHVKIPWPVKDKCAGIMKDLHQ
jgi:hypothetical protein